MLVLSACDTLPSEQVAIDAAQGADDAESEEADVDEESAPEAEAEPDAPSDVNPDAPAASGYRCTDGSDPFAGAELRFSFNFWPETDFCQHTIDYGDVIGLLRADQIPPIDAPEFEPVADADARIQDQEPVMVYVENDDARAYPLSIMTWHEIVNDTVGGRPVAVTYCPLCNAGIVFDRMVDGQELTFGTTGNLRNSDLVMWDRQTLSWWQQFTGEGIVGEMTGTQLEFLPSNISSWGAFTEAYPDGVALLPAAARDYGRNPYIGYDTNENPFAFVGEIDPRLSAVERVLGVIMGGEAVAYPFETLSEAGVVGDTVGGQDVVVFYQPGQVSALDEPSIPDSRDVGSAAAYDPNLDGQALTFSYADGVITDNETGSEWNIFGQAVSGPLAGEELVQMLAYPHFWFAWAVFQPETTVWGAV
jgi:hypothetical protein